MSIVKVSNESEFCLDSVTAEDLIAFNGLSLQHEVNPIHVVEMDISMAENVTRLNDLLEESVGQLLSNARQLGGSVYAGGSVLEDVSRLEPARYRTTCLSNTLAHGLLDISSHQIVIGIQGEEFGFQLYNLLRKTAPVMLALSSSSPFAYGMHDTGYQSRRIAQYQQMCSRFPESILDSPALGSLIEHTDTLAHISDEVLHRLENGDLDANFNELYRQRDGGSYAPFEMLEPHQVYWMNRPRPDHANAECDMAIESRVCDIPATIEGMKMMNSFILGLCYYAEKKMPEFPETNYEDLMIAARFGLMGNIAGKPIRKWAVQLFEQSLEGLRYRAESSLEYINAFDKMYKQGTQAEVIRRKDFGDSNGLKQYLIGALQ